MNDLAIAVRYLTIAYSDFRLMIENPELDKGYVYGLIGKNGSVKTTLTNALLDLVPHYGDDIRPLGQKPKENKGALKSRVAYISDEFIFPGNNRRNNVLPGDKK